jgi:hypothetical protein
MSMNKESLLTTQAEEVGFDASAVSNYWVKTKEGSYHVKRDNPATYEQMRDAMIAEMQAHAPKYEMVSHRKGGHLLVIDPADVHIGKLSRINETSYEYDIGIASKRVRDGVAGVIAKAEPYGISAIAFIIGNDILHTDNARSTTTSGTPQDQDGMWWEMFTEARKCLVAAIETCAAHAEVYVFYCPSNHDFVSGFMLADSIASWFHNHPNVHFGDDGRNGSIAHRKYFVYGRAVIGITHGDGAKEKDLPTLMQYEAREAWGKSDWGYWYCHHIHHKDRKAAGKNPQRMEKDHIGVTVANLGQELNPKNNVYIEYIRSPSVPDPWHSRNGYDNLFAIEAFLHDPLGKQCARFTHHF